MAKPPTLVSLPVEAPPARGASRAEAPRLGGKVRALRRRFDLTQAQLAERLGISPSYLNLIESNKRPLPAELLIALASQFQVDLASFTVDEDARTVADLLEAFADPLFEELPLSAAEVRELAQSSPAGAQAVITLYRAYRAARASADALATQLDEEQLARVDRAVIEGGEPPRGAEHVEGARPADLSGVERSRISSEEVNDLLQRRNNHFPELEAAAEELWRRARFDRLDLYPALVRFLERELDVKVHTVPAQVEPGVLRRFDPEAKELLLSELLPTRSRNFQLAHTIGLMLWGDTMQRIVSEEQLTVPASRSLARVALANYFAGAVLMPYEDFHRAATETRYDLDVIGRRFRVSFEQVAHRLTTLSRPERPGVRFHYIRIDIAGNISKRFSASGIRIARFSGACPRWNVFAAFLTPTLTRVQISEMPDNQRYFCIARMIHRDGGGWQAQHPVHAIGLGCRLEDAHHLVYADGVDLTHAKNVVPVGVNCRVCERNDCEQRALPSVRQALQVDERIRRVSPFAPDRGR